MSAPWRTALIGFGKMGQGYAADPITARYFQYATHAQVLRDHPAFDWMAVVDPAGDALRVARDKWDVRHCAATPGELGSIADEIEVAVLATSPDVRLNLLDLFPRLRAVLVEKPLGRDLASSRAFLDACARREILVQVNLWRRADRLFRGFASGELASCVGEPQAATFYYGNGLLNNGTHMIDFARMLVGDVGAVQLIGSDDGFVEGPIPGDRNPHFALWMRSGLAIGFQPIRFAEYRENGLTIWGTAGRLDILAEGLVVQHFRRVPHRAMQEECEIAVDAPERFEATAGTALYEMFDNLAAALRTGDQARLLSPGESALETSRIVELVRGLSRERMLLDA